MAKIEQRLADLEGEVQRLQNLQGKPGLDGKDGKDGKDGQPGKDGVNGIDGVSNTPGLTGAAGKPGEPGKDGLNGKDGKDGKDGRNGVDGKSITGPAGRDAKVQIGSVTVGEAGVTIHEENGVQVLNFTIPQGQAGKDGKDSTVQGPAGEPGKNGITLDEVSQVITDLIGVIGSESLQKLVSLNHEILLIEKDPKYVRLGTVKTEIINRLRAHLEQKPQVEAVVRKMFEEFKAEQLNLK